MSLATLMRMAAAGVDVGGEGGASLVGMTNETFQNSGDVTLSVDLPSVTIESGDVLVLWMQTRNTVLTGSPDGGGWTEHFNEGVGSSGISGAANERVALWTATASGGETAVDVPIDDQGTDNQMFVTAVIRGASYQAHSLDVSETSTPTATSISGTDGGILLGLWGSSFDTAGNALTGVDAAMTEQAVVDGGDFSYAAGSEELSSTGATGTRTASTDGTVSYCTSTLVSFEPT